MGATALVGAAEAAMPSPSIAKHRGFRRSHKGDQPGRAPVTRKVGSCSAARDVRAHVHFP